VRLEQFSYWEQKGPGEEWQIEGLVFGQFNLVVGRNATGKTRLLNAIARAAADKSGEPTGFAGSARFQMAFPDVREIPDFPEVKNATGAELAGSRVEASALWGKRAQYFPFAGRMNLKIAGENDTFQRLELPEAYRRGRERWGREFSERIVHWMNEVGYPIEAIEVEEGSMGGLTLGVKEVKRAVITPVQRLSQGEQRALTLLTFLASLEAAKNAATVLIDDFGEGLDFEHAARATDFLLGQITETQMQFIVATNDRYVMNRVPLELWTILVEEGTRTRVFNYANSKQKFDDFKFSGLNNFDFFSMDFASAEA
jgi:energy-coupling factor transporter ATP-binding protein EcfA2